jgi:hypothetical protein
MFTLELWSMSLCEWLVVWSDPTNHSSYQEAEEWYFRQRENGRVARVVDHKGKIVLQ